MVDRDVELAHQAGVLGEFKDLHPDMVEFVKLIRADEREACAKLVDDMVRYVDGHECATAIRARGQG